MPPMSLINVKTVLDRDPLMIGGLSSRRKETYARRTAPRAARPATANEPPTVLAAPVNTAGLVGVTGEVPFFAGVAEPLGWTG